ncbi:YunC family protein [Thermogymnomonas acidicola]|uniref:DUF1805 domain-containing protein n=1 Tax=Thermogymnomonas acidicola TaxID=399579 RepID=UPI0013967ECB|nr:DUF1805 domain-containing protein [Thermogymnomonas acidicola]
MMCGYLDIETADRVGDVAVRVTGVRSLGDMLSATVRSVTGKARELGIREGQSVREILGGLIA